ncbi:Ig-like domain-containing protein, partial [Mycobacterium sp. 852014-52144_SCH5372336]|uniref:Ig-like domain-containing protein n=1 Tax=Mycobacterium sp. 852014-52144_SCH5372336 TaxID=1834115 RepID=UPI001E36AC35
MDVGGGVVVSAQGEVRDPGAGSVVGSDKEAEEEPREEVEEEPPGETGPDGGAAPVAQGPVAVASGSSESQSTQSTPAPVNTAPESSVSATQIDLSGERAAVAAADVVARSQESTSVVSAVNSVVLVPEPSAVAPQRSSVTSEPESVTSSVVSVLSDFLAGFGGPEAPVNSPAEWVMLAAARREVGADEQLVAPVGVTGEVPNALLVTAADVDNDPPVARVTVGRPSAATGVVTGTVSATDPDRDVLTYTKIGDPAHGSVEFDPVKRKFVYTPRLEARHAAASPTGAKTDAFVITVDDGHGSPVAVTVTVPISAKNVAPNASGSIGLPDNSSGVVSGRITPGDADNDVVTYSSTSTVKGAVVFNPDGTFTYTPTAAARAAVRTGGAAAKTEKFTVT